jgi:hypothetical protein
LKTEDLGNARMHPIMLSFQGDLEHKFLSYYNKKYIRQIRYALIVGAIFTSVYVIFDNDLLPSVKNIEEYFTQLSQLIKTCNIL